MAFQIPDISALIPSRRRIVRLSPAKKESMARHKRAVSAARQSRKVAKLLEGAEPVTEQEAIAVQTADYDHEALGSIIKRWNDLFTSDDERDDVISIVRSHLRGDDGGHAKYRALLQIMSERQRSGW